MRTPRAFDTSQYSQTLQGTAPLRHSSATVEKKMVEQKETGNHFAGCPVHGGRLGASVTAV
jgi:hypothetical protein